MVLRVTSLFHSTLSNDLTSWNIFQRDHPKRVEQLLLMPHPYPLNNARAPFPPLGGNCLATNSWPLPQTDLPESLCALLYHPRHSSAHNWLKFLCLKRGSPLWCSSHSRAPLGSATGQLQPRVHLCSTSSLAAPLPSLLSWGYAYTQEITCTWTPHQALLLGNLTQDIGGSCTQEKGLLQNHRDRDS